MLVYDFLFGPGIQCGGELKQCILKNKVALQSCLARLKVRAKVHRNEDLLPKGALDTGREEIIEKINLSEMCLSVTNPYPPCSRDCRGGGAGRAIAVPIFCLG